MEAGKVNISRLGQPFESHCMGLEGEARDVVTDSILDWRDADDLYRINGAENDYYQSLKEPYNCKNVNLDAIEELLLIRGVTQDLFYGKKETKKAEGGEAEKEGRIGLRDIFSIYSFGEQVDINSAAIHVLRVVLGFPADVARQIVKAREEKGFLNQQDLLQRVAEVTPFIGEAGKLIVYQSATPYYTIESKKRQRGSVQGIKVVVKIDSRDEPDIKSFAVRPVALKNTCLLV
jgi:general secretion pathway protein K